jgi:hypothetical protein
MTEKAAAAKSTNGNATPIASFVGARHKPDELCAFCAGTVNRNYHTGQKEVLISCVECGSSGELTRRIGR